MTTSPIGDPGDDRPSVGLYVAGVAAMFVAALGTVAFAPPASTEPPTSDTCQLDAGHGTGWTGSDCVAPTRVVDVRR